MASWLCYAYPAQLCEDYQMWYEDSRPCKTGRDGFDVGKRCVPPVFSPACSNGMVKSYDFEGPMSKQDSTEVNVTAALYPLDKTYSASTKVCPAASCLGKPGKECGRFYCCKSQGSIPDAVMLSHDHVAVLLLGCRGNINHEFHQSFWPFFWWTTIYANTNFAILVDRMSEHPRVKCESPFWQEDLFWKLASVKRWKIYNMSTGPQNYCTTGQLHLMKGSWSFRVFKRNFLGSLRKKLCRLCCVDTQDACFWNHSPCNNSGCSSILDCLIYSFSHGFVFSCIYTSRSFAILGGIELCHLFCFGF